MCLLRQPKVMKQNITWVSWFLAPCRLQNHNENMQSTCVVNLPKVIIESCDNIIQILKIPEQTNANYSVCWPFPKPYVTTPKLCDKLSVNVITSETETAPKQICPSYWWSYLNWWTMILKSREQNLTWMS